MSKAPLVAHLHHVTVRHTGTPPFAARSASGRTDDWPFWYVVGTDGINKMSADPGFYGGKFVPREWAEQIAVKLNDAAQEPSP